MLAHLLRLWTGPLPQEELFPQDRVPNPLLHWLLHPLKRHLARNYLKILQKFFGLQVIAIAGSNGKTTTRNLLLAQLPQAVATADSVTSTYNIPTSILKLRPWTRYFICEMSVEYIGDMDFYLWLAQPQLAILTLIDIEHTRYFGSLENVAREELKILRGKWLKIINGNSPLIPFPNYANCFTFGTNPSFHCHIQSAQLTPAFTTQISLRLQHHHLTINLPAIGTHLAHPLAAALLAASKLGLNLENCQSKIEQLFTPPPHRLQIVRAKSGAIIIDDTYNSNPSSAHAAIDTAAKLARLTHRQLVLILSQMNELGPYETAEHQKLKTLLSRLQPPPARVFSVGPAAAKIGQNFSHSADLIAHVLKCEFDRRHLILVKSSRSWKLENLVSQM